MEDKTAADRGDSNSKSLPSDPVNPQVANATLEAASRQQSVGLNGAPRHYSSSFMLPFSTNTTGTSYSQSQQLMDLLNGQSNAINAATSPLTAAFASQHATAGHANTTHFLGATNDQARLLPAQTNAAFLSPNVQNWSLEQLENHVKLCQHLQQETPRSISILLAEAKKTEEKREAKRRANRRSSSTARARQKTQMKEMTDLNARLKLEARILSQLPDLVIVISTSCVVTFCSDQVERTLCHKIDELVGSKLTDILVPSSKLQLENLVNELVEREKAAITKRVAEVWPKKKEPPPQAEESSGNVTGHTVSDPSLSLSAAQNVATGAGSDGSEKSNLCQKTLLLATGGSVPLSSTTFGNEGFDSASREKVESGVKDVPVSNGTFNDSMLPNNTANKLQHANANLERNVRWHNTIKYPASQNPAYSFKDDVVGEGVTANNASAHLSSLQHRTESLSEDDSGYRESNASREELSSSDGDVLDLKARHKSMVPTCNICLIRNDQSTIWCEVTSSIRTRTLEDEVALVTEDSSSSSSRGMKGCDRGATVEGESTRKEGTKEILLCLRPIRDEELMPKKRRFEPGTSKLEGEKVVSEGTSTDLASGSGGTDDAADTAAPPRKR